jgi:nitrogen fixation protein NifQ
MRTFNDAEMRALLVTDLLGRPAQAQAARDPLRPIIASLLVGRSRHEGVLPETLGLSPTVFQQLMDDYFPGPCLKLQSGGAEEIAELSDLVNLLLEYRASLTQSETWMAQIVACGCAGRDHLWQDLGLANRGELSMLMNTAFSTLAALNTGDMKWKKFIYRHYCAKEGIYVCPAPSCSACSDYDKCHAPEH